MTSRSGGARAAAEPPLAGTRVVEFAGIGPAPLACMMLSDLGADVVRISRPGGGELDVIPAAQRDPVLRGRRIVEADLVDPATHAAVSQLIERADVLVEGFRPGAMERLGFGPADCLASHPGLIYGRMTGWGQDGPAALSAGHDINYLAVTGALHAIGRADERPPVPLNLIGDYGGGSTFLVLGILAALLERGRSGRGQVIDTAMIDGVSALLQPVLSWRAAGLWTDERESNLLDGAAPYYDTYVCSDGRFVAVGAIEKRFYAGLLTGLGLSDKELPDRADRANWPGLRTILQQAFRGRTRDEWAAVFRGGDACVTPVLTFAEAADHPQVRSRGSLFLRDGRLESAPAPRFSRSGTGSNGTAVAADLAQVLASWPRQH
ncbi:MAG: CaiB/BaiF CoA-transferase family protein [Nakamurella sp.]